MNTQKTRILAWLTQWPICSTTLLEQRIPRGAARISELRNDGWIIETRPCTQDHLHNSRQIEYVLLNSPGIMQPDIAKYATPAFSEASYEQQLWRNYDRTASTI